MTDKPLLVVGAGSVGKRHLRNFSSLGFRVSAMDPLAERLTQAAEAVPLVSTWTNLDAALNQAQDFSGVVICSPPRFHVEQALRALQANLPVLLEKPVSPDAESAFRLMNAVQSGSAPVLLGYTYRWWEPVLALKKKLDDNLVGRVLHVRCVLSAHLTDWHPGEPLQQFFMSSKELGGGALLDESHFLDLMLWFFGLPEYVFAKIERLSSLEIDSDDNVDAWLSYANNLRVWLHLDLYGRPHERSITIIGENGTLQWAYERNNVRYSRAAGQEWEEEKFTCERNEMFLGVAREFLRVLEGTTAPSCTSADGYAVMRVIEAMRQSSDTGQVVTL